jgi:hypothetical protein
MNGSLLVTMRRAMLPLDGSIAEHAPAIVAAYARLVPRRDWPQITVVDLTAGSCLLPLLFAGRGIGRLVINDTAARSQLAAAALFGRRRLDIHRIRRLVTTPAPRLRRHMPSFHFASDYLTADVADAFDRLFYARLPAAERAAYRYLALRWVLGFVPSPEHEFAVLPTHAYDQLERDREHDWRHYIGRARRKLPVLTSLAMDINAAIDRAVMRRVEIRRADMLTLCRDVDYGRRAFVVINPPTRGLDEYVIDDQLAHSLLANRWLPLSRSREAPGQFWRRRVEAALQCLPAGSHALVWGGDGSLTWSQCLRVWRRHGDAVVIRRAGRGPEAPGWAIFEKRP